MPRPRVLRYFALIVALLHLMVPPLATVADAWVERDVARSGQPTLHVDGDGSSHCPRIHPTDCGLCHAVATLATPARVQHPLPVASRAVAAPVATILGADAVGRSTLALPRAPPVA